MAKPTDRVMMAGFIFIMVVESEFRVSGFRVKSKQDSAKIVCTCVYSRFSMQIHR